MRPVPLSLLIPFVLMAAAVLPRPSPGVELGEVRLYECIKTNTPPKIDGRLDDPCWRQADETNAFTCTLATGESPPTVQTHFRIVYDERNLYIGVRCDEPHPDRIKADITDNDSPSVCSDDCIEIFLHPNPSLPDFHHFAVNARGTRYDGRIFDGAWNGIWEAATQIGKDAWFVECAIALESFPECRGIWRFNMNREFRSTGHVEYHCWSNTFGAFHTPERFGCLIFSGPLANLRRGYILQAANYARSTLDKEAAFDSRLREIRQMRASLPAPITKPHEKALADLDRNDRLLMEKYSRLKAPTIQEWEGLDRGLDALLDATNEVYWELKFQTLLND